MGHKHRHNGHRHNGAKETGGHTPEKQSLSADTTDLLALPANTDRAVLIAEAGDRVARQEGKLLYRTSGKDKINLDSIDPEGPDTMSKKDAKQELHDLRLKLEDLQVRLYAEGLQSLLIVLQTIDAGGKDGTIRHVFKGVNPQGCRVWSFKVPTPEEMAHDFLWRYHIKCPGRGMIGLFNRSHYEDVLVARVRKLVPEDLVPTRFRTIKDFERGLTLNNTTILKFFLYISKDEQKQRLQARIDDPKKNWKFNPGDLDDRALWDSYMAAYEDAINNCSTDYAPWYVVPANRKWLRNLVVMRTIVETLTAMDPKYPAPVENLQKIVIT